MFSGLWRSAAPPTHAPRHHPAEIRGLAAIAVVAVVAAGLTPASAVPPGMKRSVGKLTTTKRISYRILQGEKEVGKESCEERDYDNNAIVFEIENSLSYGPGIGMSQKTELTLEDESHFPRKVHAVRTIQQQGGDFEHRFDVEMFSNVAVLSSTLKGVADSRRVVVPTGIAFQEVGVLSYWYQTLFWYDRSLGGRQRFQWFEPVLGKIEAGEVYLSGDETLTVLGKKTPVSVFKVERETLGPVTLWVDAAGAIVRAEQNLMIYELVEDKKL